MLLLSEKEIKSIYTMESAIKDLENALVHNQEGKILNPHRTVLDFPEKKASALYMPSALPPIGKTAVKVVTIFPENPAVGKKTTQGVILLSDTETGEHLACMNASYLTRLRTGAVSGIATKHLAKKSARSVAVIGCGAMAEEQLQAVLEVRKIEEIFLYNRTAAKAHEFADKFKEFNCAVTILENADEAVSRADIVICSTRSEKPVFSGKALQQGTHINGVGSYLPHMQEVDAETLLRSSKIVVDTIEGVKDEAGDFIVPAAEGIWSFSDLHGEIGQLSSGMIAGRENDEEITFFKSVGIAYFDLAVAAAVYEKAILEGVGTKVDL
ncbi:NAD(P)-binding domain-containing protein [Cytobacillus oceanisediminis]|uniref:ornithine cyclodeaminase family protein n=1 Tax=Cytobacillus oceanisediminis TaxID=665099 RepID=UPI001D15C185|nr:NAD(P)-binding domain-containing protein [Cytobacillus oceanisediminis]MCC3648196.1 NAD(P)-binding domain-containing protein [Cytobacillus oceanisediminis]